MPPFSHSLSSPVSASLAAGHPLAQLTEVGWLPLQFSKLLAGQFPEPSPGPKQPSAAERHRVRHPIQKASPFTRVFSLTPDLRLQVLQNLEVSLQPGPK